MLPIIKTLLPTVINLAKNSFTKENLKESPTTLLAAAGMAGGGPIYYASPELGAFVLGFSVALFFMRDK